MKKVIKNIFHSSSVLQPCSEVYYITKHNILFPPFNKDNIKKVETHLVKRHFILESLND